MALITMEDMEGISPVFKGKFGNGLARLMMRITGVDKLSERYGRHEDLSGQEFVSAFLKDLNLNYEVQGLEHLPSEILNGPFITISNHPYGGLDGLLLIDLFGHFREDYKLMVNKFLSKAKTLDDNFIYVVPKTKSTKGISQESIEGLRKTLKHINEGHPLGIFPSGAVSDFSFKDFCVRDREWQQPAVELIRYLKVPVVPVRFFDRNSNWFYFLGLINWRLRTLWLPREILNKEDKTIKLGIGQVISVKEQMRISEADFAAMLRSSVYGIVESNK
jgi:putative hemolysin